ncbi:thioredoxin family protein [Desertivirga arenae]|uniref:thioredoxin family protein n=1 Tax=Desertivirga arenae TaxID=2810309 RepID=UPI001A97CC75|nr:thioredoxin family protein [Pedobacter sp. SYSU D00823]
MKRLKLGILLLLIFSFLATNAQESQFTTISSWTELLSKAKQEKKLIIIDSYFQGCHPCKQMDDEVFPLEPVMKLMKENFISTKIDFLKEDLGKQLQIKYAVTGFPTFLILNSEGQLLSRFSGYQEGDKFENLLRIAISKSDKGEVLKGFSSSLDINYPDFYIATIKERKPYTTQDLLNYLKGKDIAKEANAIPFLFNRSAAPELGEILLNNYNTLEEMYGRELVWTKRINSLAVKLKSRIPIRDDAKFATFLSEVQPIFAEKDWSYGKLDIAEEYFYKQCKDHKAFFKYAVENFNDDENKVRYMAFNLSGPAVDAEEKMLYSEWMRKVVKESSSYEVLTIAAKLMNDQGNTEQAKTYAKWGLAKSQLLKKDSGFFKGILN